MTVANFVIIIVLFLKYLYHSF